MDVLVSRFATRAAESKWRLMGANSLAEATQTFKARIRRSIGVEGAKSCCNSIFYLLKYVGQRHSRAVVLSGLARSRLRDGGVYPREQLRLLPSTSLV